jgi:hypothetical protein
MMDFMHSTYPKHIFFPRSMRPPEWVQSICSAFAQVEEDIDSTKPTHRTSNEVLGILRPRLEAIGFKVESGKRVGEKLHRPVFFGEMGEPSVKYEIDAYHQEFGIVLEVEAGRSIKGNAIYKDIIQMSLMVDARCAVIAMPIQYSFLSGHRRIVNRSYEDGKRLLDAIWGSQRMKLPFEGMLLVGY